MTPPETCPHCGAERASGKFAEDYTRWNCESWATSYDGEQSERCKDRQIERLTAALERITKLSFKENQEWIPQSIAREALNPDKTPGGAK